MRIVQVANFVKADSGGIRRCLTQLRHEYELRGHRVTTVVPGSGGENPPANFETVKGTAVPFTGGYHAIVGRRPLRDLLENLQPDLVELSDKTTLAWLPEWLSRRKVPCAVISHERTDIVSARHAPKFLPIPGLVDHFRGRIVEHASVIICASQFAADEFRNDDTRPNQIRLVPLGVDLETFRPVKSASQSDVPSVVVCGRLSPEKQPLVAVQGFIELLRSTPARLTIIGDGPLRVELEELTRGLPVTFRGFVADPREIAQTIASCDAALNLGPIETFGLATLELLACGVPVVVSNEGGSREVIDTDAGRAVPAAPEEIARALEDLLSIPTDIRQRAARSRAEHFPWSSTADALLDIYNELGSGITASRLSA